VFVFPKTNFNTLLDSPTHLGSHSQGILLMRRFLCCGDTVSGFILASAFRMMCFVLKMVVILFLMRLNFSEIPFTYGITKVSAVVS
jgi:hypothetical protein